MEREKWKLFEMPIVQNILDWGSWNHYRNTYADRDADTVNKTLLSGRTDSEHCREHLETIIIRSDGPERNQDLSILRRRKSRNKICSDCMAVESPAWRLSSKDRRRL